MPFFDDRIHAYQFTLIRAVKINFSFLTQQSKGGILSKACDYITDIRNANQRLAEALRQSEHHVEELQAENAALRKELEQLHMSGMGKS